MLNLLNYLFYIWIAACLYYLYKTINYMIANPKKVHWTELLLVPFIGPFLLIINWKNIH